MHFQDVTSKKKKIEYTFFSRTYGISSRTEHLLGHKSNPNKFKNIEIISSIFSNNNGMKLKINHRKRNEKNLTTGRIKNTLLKKKWVKEGIKKKIKKYLEANDNEERATQNIWDFAKPVLKGKSIEIQDFL